MDRIRIAVGILLALTATASAQPPPTRAPDQPAWYESALRFVPPSTIAGYAIRNDEAEVELKRNGNALEAASATLRPREPDEIGAPQGTASADQTKQFIDINRAVATKFKNLPPGTMACNFGAYSIDKDPKGLNVRAEPSAQSHILGTLPPPYRFKAKGNNVPEGGWRTEFLVIGFKDGWFLIQGAPRRRVERSDTRSRRRHYKVLALAARFARQRERPPGQEYEDAQVYPKNHPHPYAGRGWVAGNKIGANFANGATRMGGLFQAPDADARWRRVTDKQGNEIGGDMSPDRILACSGLWALVEKNGIRGWWRHLCSNQVTNCS